MTILFLELEVLIYQIIKEDIRPKRRNPYFEKSTKQHFR